MLTVKEAILESVADVWNERLQALDGLMYAMTRDYDALSLARWDTLKPAIKCLQAFGRDIFTYFHAGFASHRLEIWDDYPPDSVYSIILNQIGYDLEILQRAVEQRTSGSAAMTETLKATDKLACLALKPAIDTGLLPPDTTAITYFQKSPVSRVVPYAPVAFIGVPYSCIAVARDHLALPHEIGHYVFWHARAPQNSQPLHRLLRRSAVEELKSFVTVQSPAFPGWCYQWLEELFADVYGALSAGPVMALDFQELSLHSSCIEFITSDDDHPVPVLRPDIYNKVLYQEAAANNQWSAWADVLSQHWQQRCLRCGGSDLFKAGGQSIPLKDAISIGPHAADDKPVDRLVKLVMDQLPGAQSDWAGNPEPSANVDDLFDSQRAYLPTLLATVTQTLDPNPKTAALWLKRAQNIIDLSDTGFVTAEVWLQHLIADGWTTEGPDPRWP
jgi:hypothetical protein